MWNSVKSLLPGWSGRAAKGSNRSEWSLITSWLEERSTDRKGWLPAARSACSKFRVVPGGRFPRRRKSVFRSVRRLRSHYFIPLSRSRFYGARCDAQVTRRGPTNEYICSTKRAAAARPSRFLCCTRVTTDDDSTTCLRTRNAVSRSMKLSPIVDAPLSHESTSPTFRVDRTAYLSRQLCAIERFAIISAFFA